MREECQGQWSARGKGSTNNHLHRFRGAQLSWTLAFVVGQSPGSPSPLRSESVACKIWGRGRKCFLPVNALSCGSWSASSDTQR